MLHIQSERVRPVPHVDEDVLDPKSVSDQIALMNTYLASGQMTQGQVDLKLADISEQFAGAKN